MARLTNQAKRHYGEHPLHLMLLLGCFAFVGYVISVVGPQTLWNSHVWWQSIVVWFLGAVLLHDLILFPLYAVWNKSLMVGWHALRGRLPHRQPRLSPVNYLRLPVMGSGLLFLMFFPGIIEQGKRTYLNATGQTQQPYLGRWLLITAAMFGVSAVAYGIRSRLVKAGVGDGDRSTSDSTADGSHELSP
jgi:hypothetical protein